MMRINLIFPPLWECDSPYSSIAYLSSYLKKNGHDVNCCDLNIEIQNYILSKRGLEEAEQKLKQVMNLADVTKLGYIKKIYKLYELVGQDNILNAVKLLRETTDIDVIIRSKRICEIGRYLYSASYYPAYFESSVYVSGFGQVNNMNTLLEAIDNEDQNIFQELMELYVDKHKHEFEVWGISIASTNQLIPGFTLAKIIKAKVPNAKVVIGGAVLPYMKSVIQISPEIFQYVDCLIIGEGETPLNSWLAYLEGKEELHRVPNILYAEKDSIKVTPERSIEDLNSLFTPDYANTDWSLYFSSQHILSYLTARGCYWNKCTFCGLTSNFSQLYRQRDMLLVLNDIDRLTHNEGVKYINFNDEALSPSRLKQLSEGILARNLKFYWTCLSRLDMNMDKQLFQLCYKAGLRIISFGLESASEKVLQKMNKGIDLNKVPQILKSSHEVGIWNNLYLILGFPGETDLDVELTRVFIKENGDYIDSLGYGSFRLDGYSRVYQEPNVYNIYLKQVDQRYFGPDYPFEYNNHQIKAQTFQDFNNSMKQEKYHHDNFECVDMNNIFLLTAKLNKDEIREVYFNKRLRKKTMLDNACYNGVSISFQLHSIRYDRVSYLKGSSLMLFNTQTGATIELDGSLESLLDQIKTNGNSDKVLNYLSNLYTIEREKCNELLEQLIVLFRKIDGITMN